MTPRRHGPNWESRGAKCLKFPPAKGYDPWFAHEHEQDAKDICNGTWDGKICPARDECLIYACVNNESYGVWGGKSEEERILMRRAVRRKYRLRPDQAPISEWTWQHLEQSNSPAHCETSQQSARSPQCCSEPSPNT